MKKNYMLHVMNSVCRIRVSFMILVSAFILSSHILNGQTCPYGSPTAATGYAITATGGSSGTTNATGTILASGSTLSASNSATCNTSVPLTVDFQKWVAQGSSVTIAWSRSSGTPSVSVQGSNDNVTFTSLGTLSGSGSASSVYTSFTVPSGGVRYIRLTATSGNFFVDGVRYTHTCYYPAQGTKDTRVVLSPGTSKGSLAYNDLNYDNDAKTYSLYGNVSNGSVSVTSAGNYTYTPNTGFEGVDIFSYILMDAGPDGNISTTTDNGRDTTIVTLRTLFNCDSSTFYLPIPENEAIDFLKDVSPSAVNADPTDVYIGISVASDAIVIYDHWEDGFETNIKAPSQSTTMVWGDGDLSNGVAPGFPTDILDAGQAIILSNSLSSGHTGSTSYNPNAASSDAILQATIDYDGKDKVFIGGIGAMTKLAWGSIGTPSVCGAAVPPTKKWGTSYVLPVGINTPNSGTSFQLASLSILAKDAATTVNIDRDNNGTVDVTVLLGQGETYYLDSRFGGSAVTVNQGATITANKPIMVNLMTGQYNTLPYQGRTFALIPNAQLSTCYYMPAVPSEAIRVFIYNPNASAITVTRTTAGGSTSTISVPANSSSYNDVNSSGLGYRYCSSSPFSILSTVDYNAGNSDWGFLPVPTSNLTSKVLVGYGDGEDPTGGTLGTNNYEQAMVTVDCNTYLYVDTDGDGSADKVSFNSDVDATDNSVSIGGVNYNETTSNNGIYLQAYQTVTVGSTSGSLSGAVFWTKTAANNGGVEGCNISLVWGQNGGPISSPNIDAGYTVPNVQPDINNSVVKTHDSIIIERYMDSIKFKYANAGAVAPYKVFWFNETTNDYKVFTTSKDSFYISAIDLDPGNYLVKLRDANCRSFTRRVIVYEIPSAPVKGKVFHDPNGMVNGSIDGTAISKAGTAQLYAYLVSGNIVFDSAKVLSNGTYSVRGRQSASYTVRLSTTGVTFYATAPAQNLPAPWINVAEQYGSSNTGGTGVESGTANGVIVAGIGTTTIASTNFSIERQAFSHQKTYNLSPDSIMRKRSGLTRFPYYVRLDNASGTADTTVVGSVTTVMPGKLSGVDFEDGRFRGNTGVNGKLALTVLPDSGTNGVLAYNGVLLFANPVVGSPAYAYWSATNSRYEISSFNPANLMLYLKAVYQSSTTFTYAYIDNAGMLGQQSIYRINYLSPLPMTVQLSGAMAGTNAKLNWICFSKKDVVFYELERQSENEFSGKIIAQIDDNGQDEYHYLDNLGEEAPGSYTYTLYTINHAGERTMRGTVTLDNSTRNTPGIKAYPNPASGGAVQLNIEGFDARTTKHLTMYNTEGYLVLDLIFTGNFASIETETIPDGVYIVQVSDSKTTSATSVIIRR